VQSRLGGLVGDMTVAAIDRLEFAVLDRIHEAIARGIGVERALARITRAAARLCEAQVVGITALAGGGREVALRSVFPADVQDVGIPIPVADSLSGLVIASERNLCSHDALHDRRPLLRAVARIGGVRAVLAVPVCNGNGPFGMLAVTKHVPHAFTHREVAAVTLLANCASIALQQPRKPASPPGAPADALHPEGLSSDHLPPAPSGALTVHARPLSVRQRDVVRLVAAGKTAREAAALLGLSARTVEHHLERLKHRFRVPRLHPLLTVLIASGLLSDPLSPF